MKLELTTPIEELNRINKGTLMEQLHIEYLEIAEGFVKAGCLSMNVRFNPWESFTVVRMLPLQKPLRTGVGTYR